MGKGLTSYLAYSNCLKADILILLDCQGTMINLVVKKPKNYFKEKLVGTWIHGSALG
jgi:hypothetical protein